MQTLENRLLEPINTLTHVVGIIASFIGLVILLPLTRHDPPKMWAMLIYGTSMILLYTSSSLLHGVKASDTVRFWLNRLDHIAIFLLIAGTYTPIAFTVFANPWRNGVLIVVWSVVLVGIGFKLFTRRIHGLLNTSIYVILGWGSALPLLFASQLFTIIPWQGFLFLLLGGLIYSVGFLIYYFHWPDPWPDTFGHHEIWHLFVLGGSLCHYLFILWYIVPYERLAA